MEKFQRSCMRCTIAILLTVLYEGVDGQHVIPNTTESQGTDTLNSTPFLSKSSSVLKNKTIDGKHHIDHECISLENCNFTNFIKCDYGFEGLNRAHNNSSISCKTCCRIALTEVSQDKPGHKLESTLPTDLKNKTVKTKDNIIDTQKYSKLFINVKIAIFTTGVLVGILANLFSLLIVIKQGLIKSGVWVYIAALSISDSFTLIGWYIYEFSKEPVNYFWGAVTYNNLMCKLIVLFSYWPGAVSIYILAFLTVERAVLVWNPYRQPRTQKQAILVVITITLVMISGYTAWILSSIELLEYPVGTFNGNDTNVVGICTLHPKYYKYLTIYIWVDFTINYSIPVFLVVIANICIIYTLMKRARNKTIQRDHTNAKKDVKITRMLMVMSITLVVTLTPNALYITVLWKYFFDNTETAFAFDNVAYTTVYFFSLILYMGNFFIYILSGETFRDEVVKFFKNMSWCQLPSSSQADENQF